MNPVVKEKWVAALRSGEYQQTTGYLNILEDEPTGRKPGFCCLGVLCDLAMKDGVELDVADESEGGLRFRRFDNSGALLPLPVVEWAGLDADDPPIDGHQKQASVVNDDGATFERIADLIERNL